MQNHLKDQTSPYLLQHVNNPVDWFPWCEEAFEKAKAEGKGVVSLRGKMIDAPIVARARQVLEAAEAMKGGR